MLKKRVKLFGVYIDDVDMDVATALAKASLHGGRARVFFTPNFEMLAEARRSREIRELLNSSSVNLCDGTGVKLVAKFVGKTVENRVAGIDFGERLLFLAEKEGARVFLLGGEKGVAKKAKSELSKKHPELNICGAHHGYFCELENDGICDMINKSGADILIVCRGFPQQERFVIENREKLKNIKVFACLGGALDVWSGDIDRAPEGVRKLNCEWLWRIANEPRRAKRFLSSLPLLFYAICNYDEKTGI